jgi:hypothetical protein
MSGFDDTESRIGMVEAASGVLDIGISSGME